MAFAVRHTGGGVDAHISDSRSRSELPVPGGCTTTYRQPVRGGATAQHGRSEREQEYETWHRPNTKATGVPHRERHEQP